MRAMFFIKTASTSIKSHYCCIFLLRHSHPIQIALSRDLTSCVVLALCTLALCIFFISPVSFPAWRMRANKRLKDNFQFQHYRLLINSLSSQACNFPHHTRDSLNLFVRAFCRALTSNFIRMLCKLTHSFLSSLCFTSHRIERWNQSYPLVCLSSAYNIIFFKEKATTLPFSLPSLSVRKFCSFQHQWTHIYYRVSIHNKR